MLATCRAPLLLALLLASARPVAAPDLALDPSSDALDALLDQEGLSREDLGWRPRGWWSRYPADIPHKLRHFDDLLAEPLATVTFARTAGAAVRSYLDPEALARVPEKADPALYKAVYALGVERRYGGFRSYSSNLTAEPTDLVEALLALRRAAGRPTVHHTFGQDADWPQPRRDLEEKVRAVPEAARPVLGKLVLDLLDAWTWTERGFRRVDPGDRLAVQRHLGLADEATDALDYFAPLDDAAADWDEASLWYGGLKAVAALEEARLALGSLGAMPAFSFDWLSPMGWVRFRGSGSDKVEEVDAFLIVDLGGDDRWEGRIGAPAPGRSLSAALDLGGDDTYAADGVAAQGAGLGGVGVLVDAAGDDRYRSDRASQGYGHLGLGVLADLDGRDEYELRYAGQGAGVLGVGLLLDSRGDDVYQILGDGQGFGAAGGVGTLADREGDDRYEADPDPEATRRPSYHSEGKISVSNAQGVGLGRRGDGSDGHSWAGGLGQLLDAAGDDDYEAGNWAMGTGYWFGTGVLWDGGGDDAYEGSVWTQASGAHFCIGVLVDEAGNDRHEVRDEGRSSLSFGHDFAVTLLLDAGGDDLYERPGDGLAFSINRSFAFLLDLGGDDRYRGVEGAVPGTARYRDQFSDRSGTYTYFADASSLALFLDVGGEDDYHSLDMADGALRRDPEDSPNRTTRNWSLAADLEEGTVDLTPRPERLPRSRETSPKKTSGFWDR